LPPSIGKVDLQICQKYVKTYVTKLHEFFYILNAFITDYQVRHINFVNIRPSNHYLTIYTGNFQCTYQVEKYTLLTHHLNVRNTFIKKKVPMSQNFQFRHTVGRREKLTRSTLCLK